MATMTTRRAQKVKDSVARLRAFYELGTRAKKAWEPEPGKAVESLRRTAEEYDVSDDHLRKAMILADPVKGYGRAGLDALCRRILSSENRLGIPIGTAHVLKLLTFAGKERARWEGMILKHGWNIRQLSAEIARRHGSRRSGGRLPRVPTTADGALAQLAVISTRWLRYVQALSRGQDKQGRVPGNLADLPGSVRRRVEASRTALNELHEEIVKEMRRQRPEWQERVRREDA